MSSACCKLLLVAAVTPAAMINVSTAICLANLPRNSYLVDVYLKMLLPSGFISHMPCYIMLEDLLLLAVHTIFHLQHGVPSAFED